MKIEIVNERLLPRFGVDRLLLLLARYLLDNGHEVNLTCLRSDKELLESMGGCGVLDVPEGLNMQETERHVACLMQERFRTSPPDVLVTGGWPFFQVASEASRFDIASVFIDAGATPQDGMNPDEQARQCELRRIRKMTMPSIDGILPISDFIYRSQTLPDRGHNENVHVVLLGADHMEQEVRTVNRDSLDLLSQVGRLKKTGARIILSLGRFETRGYKKSSFSYDILRHVRKFCPNTYLLILDAGADCHIPADLQSHVITLGRPSDKTLNDIMKMCDVGLSTSLWEGFNLPIVEMQHVNCPVLAFSVGAHAEVISHPWLLCGNVDEMTWKTSRILTDMLPDSVRKHISENNNRFKWSVTLSSWTQHLVYISQKIRIKNSTYRHVLLADVTNACRDPANSGIMRVSRQWFRCLQENKGLMVLFVRWEISSKSYEFLDIDQRKCLSSYDGPKDNISSLTSIRGLSVTALLDILNTTGNSPILLTPEVALDGDVIDRVMWARGHKVKTAGILHDILPITHPKYVSKRIIEDFPLYASSLLHLDFVWSVSETSRMAFLKWAKAYGGLQQGRVIQTRWLPGQFASVGRQKVPVSFPQGKINILVVSTLEPRKNHATLIEAWHVLREKRPDLDFSLKIVGNRYSGAEYISEFVENICRNDPDVHYEGVVSDDNLADLYHESAFTIYPSLVEGFGIPIMESLWFGRPCITHKQGVMAELAEKGGCLTVDMGSSTDLAEAIEILSDNHALYDTLVREAVSRTIHTWNDFATLTAADLDQLT